MVNLSTLSSGLYKESKQRTFLHMDATLTLTYVLGTDLGRYLPTFLHALCPLLETHRVNGCHSVIEIQGRFALLLLLCLGQTVLRM